MEFPNETYDYVQKNGLVESIVRYIIDRRFRRSVYLKPWLADQVNNPTEDLVKAANSIPDSTDPGTQMMQVFKWVRSNITYYPDNILWEVPEKWQTAQETLTSKKGDCEDGAILMYVLARLKNIPANRLLLFAGEVEGGGHCWLGFRWQPHLFTFMDWCYWYDSSSLTVRKKYYVANTSIVCPTDKNYKELWFGFNEDGTYLRFQPTLKSLML